MTEAPEGVPLWQALRGQWRVLAGVLPGVAMALLHSTILDLPRADVVAALDSDRYRIQWLTGTYLVGAASGMCLTRFLAGRLGLRLTFLAGVVCFTLAAGGCGAVAEVIQMAPFRLLQGFGTGLMICAAMVLLWRAFPEHKELAMAVYGMGIYLPALAGAVVGGLLTAWLSWRLVFLINLPLGLASIGLAWRWLPPDRPAQPARLRLDVLGLALLLTWIATLNVVLDLGQYWGWLTSPSFVPWLAAFVVSFTGFVAWGVGAANPLIDLRPFAIRHFTLGIAVKVLFSINLYVLVGLLSAYMINLRGYQWWQGGLVLAPALATMLVAVAAGVRWGTTDNRQARMFLGLAVMVLTTWQLSALDLYTSKFWLAGVLAVWGAGAGLVFGPAMVILFEELSPDQTVHAAGVFNVTRAVPTFVAMSVLATLLTQRSDAEFDWLRQKIAYSRPVVAQAIQQPAQHFADRGSGPVKSGQQAHGLLGTWVHANSRAFALQTIFRDLALVTAVGPVLVLLVRRPDRTATLQGHTSP